MCANLLHHSVRMAWRVRLSLAVAEEGKLRTGLWMGRHPYARSKPLLLSSMDLGHLLSSSKFICQQVVENFIFVPCRGQIISYSSMCIESIAITLRRECNFQKECDHQVIPFLSCLGIILYSMKQGTLAESSIPLFTFYSCIFQVG